MNKCINHFKKESFIPIFTFNHSFYSFWRSEDRQIISIVCGKKQHCLFPILKSFPDPSHSVCLFAQDLAISCMSSFSPLIWSICVQKAEKADYT